MSTEIAVVGCGYTGMRLAREATSGGWEVVGTSRSEERLAELEEMGAGALRWEADDEIEGAFAEALGRADAVIYSVPTLFREYREAEEGLARHVEPVARVLERAEEGGGRFVYLSSTSVYGDHDGEWVDEETPPAPVSPVGEMRREIEEYVLGRAEPLDVNVARLVGIYGPGRTMVDYLEKGRYKLVDGGTKPSNRIHVDDIVGALTAMVERGPSGARLYNVSDGSPKRVVDLVDWLVEHLGIERPPEVSLEAYAEERGENAAARWANTYRVANDRMIEELGVELEYPDALQGYADILGV